MPKPHRRSIYFESLPYRLDESTGYIDYDKLEENANLFKPKLIIAGGSAYPREWDYKRFRAICDKVTAKHLSFMRSHPTLTACPKSQPSNCILHPQSSLNRPFALTPVRQSIFTAARARG